MPLIHLTTFIAAPQDRVFDLSRSVTLHKQSMAGHQEKIVSGVSMGLMNENDTVTWQAKHLFRQRILKVKLTKLRKPEYFIDEQEQGDFSLMKHEHYFKPVENGTIMIDQFRFETRGLMGRILTKIYLEKYLTRLLIKRNEMIKKIAESNQWKQYLS